MTQPTPDLEALAARLELNLLELANTTSSISLERWCYISSDIQQAITALRAQDAEPVAIWKDAKAIAASALQTACETDPADPEHPDTVMLTTSDFETIVRLAVESHFEAHPSPNPAPQAADGELLREIAKAIHTELNKDDLPEGGWSGICRGAALAVVALPAMKSLLSRPTDSTPAVAAEGELLPCPHCGEQVEMADIPTATAPIMHHPPYNRHCAHADRFYLVTAWNTRPTATNGDKDAVNRGREAHNAKLKLDVETVLIRAEKAEAREAALREALERCANAPLSGWTIAQGLAREALANRGEAEDTLPLP